MKLKIGLITIHDIHNFGSALQAYASIRSIEKMGHSCELIDYKFPARYHKLHAIGGEGVVSVRCLIKKIATFIFLFDLIYFFDLLLKGDYFPFNMAKKRFKTFLKKIPSSKRCDLKTIKKYGQGYDVYITGSDQTWNPRYLYRDYSFLLNFVQDTAKKISYSASFGSKSLPVEFREDYARLLSKYSAVSVRESSGISLLKDLTGQDAVHCVDPTLLLTADEWRKIADYSLCPDRPYILCYILNYVFDPYPYIFELINLIRDKLGIEVIFLTNRRNKKAEEQGYTCCSSAGPAEFLGLYDKASFVVTTSFHGTAFSVNFQKNFITVTNPNASNDDRVTDFLKTVGLEKHGIKAFTCVSVDDLPLTADYSVAEKLLDNKRRESLNYLLRAVNGE